MASEAAPIPTPVTNVSVENPFTETQWTTLMAIMDTIIPSIQKDAPNSQATHQSISGEEFDAVVDSLKETLEEKYGTELYEEYLTKKASDDPKLQNILKHAFGKLLPEANRKGMAFILSTLE
jgi:hypothetical protein